MKTKTKALALLSAVILATVAGSILFISTAKADANSTSIDNTLVSTATAPENNGSLFFMGDRMGFGGPGPRGCPRGMGQDFRGFGGIQVSDEFKTNVINIAKADSDVQNLLNTGYNITSVRPIVSSIVDANGNVSTKATSAILTLEKDTTGRATVLVDMNQTKVTKILIETRTLIEK